MSKVVDNNGVIDAQQRLDALDLDSSIICEAPAGSGKTELLTQRFLGLLTRVRKPEEVLAITFTRKAAGEMRERIINALHTTKHSAIPEEAHRRMTWQLANDVLIMDEHNNWNILDNPNRLQILTFDSLCAGLANTLPWHSSFASAPQVSDDTEELFLETVRQFLQTLESDAPWSEALALILSLLDNNTQKLEQYFVRMLHQRESWLQLFGSGLNPQQQRQGILPRLQENLENVCRDGVTKVKDCLSTEQVCELLQLVSFAASEISKLSDDSPLLACLNMDVDNNNLPDTSDKGIKQWQAIVNLLFTDKNEWRKSLTKKNGFPTSKNKEEKAFLQSQKNRCLKLIESLSEIDGLAEYFTDIKRFPSIEYDQDQAALLDAFIQVLPILAAYLTVQFQEKNSVDFSEISIRARMALGGLSQPSDLALALDYKIQHILVDEFQDTSPAQIELLTRLTDGWQQGDGRSLFCVGDAMQSIYGFRGSNVGLFLDCIERGLGDVDLQAIRLKTNFRSDFSVVDWVNHTFAKSFPARNDITVGAVTYAHSQAFSQVNIDNAVCVHGISDEYDFNDSEGALTVELVRQAKQRKPDGSIAILVRTRHHASAIASELTKAGYKYRAVDIENLADNYVVQDLMALTHAMLWPSDRVAWLSVLRAPWCGLSLADLEIVANLGINSNVLPTLIQQLTWLLDVPVEKASNTELQGDLFLQSSSSPLMQQDMAKIHLLSNSGQQRLLRVVAVLQQAIEQAQRKDLRLWVEGTWLSLGGPACLQNQQDKQNVELFFELLEKLEESTVLQKKDMLQKGVQKLFAVPDPDSDDSLQIMTIHKSKGLEFDTVILPGLHKASRNLDPELLRWYQRVSLSGDQELVLAPIKASGKDEDRVYQHLMHVERKKEENEACRLLYVACTRAKVSLHLITQVSSNPKDEMAYKTPRKGTLIHPIWQAIKTQIQEYSLDDGYNTSVNNEELDNDDNPKVLTRLQENWSLPLLPHGEILKDYIPFFEHDNVRINYREPVDHVPRIIGTLIHRILQECNIELLKSWHEHNFENCRAMWQAQLMSAGLAAVDLESALEKIQVSLTNLVEDKDRHWIFSNDHPQRYCEFEISVNSSEGVNHFIVDLLLYDGETTWIIDYKTGQPKSGESIESFMATEKSRYRKVMYQYRFAIEKLGYNNIKLALYFPMLGRWLEYD